MSARRRRWFLLVAFCFIAARGTAQERGIADGGTTVRTYTYKTVGDLDIKLDVHRPDDSSARPVLLWIHGGALIMGHRESVSQRVLQHCREAGHILVSIDYRLAPETKLPEIITDIEDAVAWVRKRGEERFHARTDKIVVAGGSAGGYLTLATGFRVNPRPTALVAFWGYGDLIGDWYSRPSPHPRHHRVKVSEEEAWRQVNGPPISDARERPGNGGVFYQFCRQHGQWPKNVSTWDPATDAAKFTPYMPVRNVSREYPPTMLIHGTDDTDVPHEQSTLMAEQFRQHSVPHEFISVENGEHGLSGADQQDIERAYQAAFRFIDRYLE